MDTVHQHYLLINLQDRIYFHLIKCIFKIQHNFKYRILGLNFIRRFNYSIFSTRLDNKSKGYPFEAKYFAIASPIPELAPKKFKKLNLNL